MSGFFNPFGSSARVDLSNYFTKDEIQDLINGINKFEIKFTAELPKKGNKYTFYFIKKKNSKDNDYYDEYYDTTQNGNWEHLGSTDIDLSGYATESSVKSITDSLSKSVVANSEAIKELGNKIENYQSIWIGTYEQYESANNQGQIKDGQYIYIVDDDLWVIHSLSDLVEVNPDE